MLVSVKEKIENIRNFETIQNLPFLDKFHMIYEISGIDVGSQMIGENLLDVVEKKNVGRPNRIFAQISESCVGRVIRTQDYLYAVYAPGVNGGEATSSDSYAGDSGRRFGNS